MFRHLVLTVGFVIAAGLPQKMKEADSSPTRRAYFTFTPQEIATLEFTPSTQRDYLDALLRARKQLATQDSYTYDQYFHDLKQVRMYETRYGDSLNATRDGQGLMFHLQYVTNEFWSANISCSGSRHSPKWGTLASARAHWFPVDAATEKSLADRKIEWHSIILCFLRWLLGFYLRGLPVACMLFLVWKIRLKKDFEDVWWSGSGSESDGELALRKGFAPISFLISLALWPFVLAVDLISRASGLFHKAEVISRRSRMLGAFSKQEERLLKLGNTMSIQEFKVYLDSIGMARKHSFAASFAVTMFLVLAPRLLVVAAVGLSEKQGAQTTATISSVQGGFDHDVGPPDVRSFFGGDALVALCGRAPSDDRLSVIFPYADVLGRLLQGFPADIGGVPKCVQIFAQ